MSCQGLAGKVAHKLENLCADACAHLHPEEEKAQGPLRHDRGFYPFRRRGKDHGCQNAKVIPLPRSQCDPSAPFASASTSPPRKVSKPTSAPPPSSRASASVSPPNQHHLNHHPKIPPNHPPSLPLSPLLHKFSSNTAPGHRSYVSHASHKCISIRCFPSQQDLTSCLRRRPNRHHCSRRGAPIPC